MWKNKNFIIFLLFFPLFILSGYTFYLVNTMHKKIGTLPKICKPFPKNVLIKSDPSLPELNITVSLEVLEFLNNFLLKQKFHWLGKGEQSNAYISSDGEYVLKLFPNITAPDCSFKGHPFKFLLSKNFRKTCEKKALQREKVLYSSKLCYEECLEETGLLYIHLNKTGNIWGSIKLLDEKNVFHKVKFDDLSFVIQKKADYVIPTFQKLMAENNIEEAKQRLEQLCTLLYSMAAKGCLGEDGSLILQNNIGFTKERAICIDIGDIVKQETVNLQERMLYEFDVRLLSLYNWLRIQYPILADHYQKLREEYICR